MNIGVLDILDLPSCNPARTVYHLLMTKQYAAITPQAISFWCRRMGHRTFYATYYGVGAPERKLPKDLDVLFIACHTPTSGLAYAVSKIFRRRGTRTVVGGPHAKAFPLDCSRFFDVTVKDCDRGLVERILADEFEPGSIVTCDPDYDELPTIEERMPEVRKSAFAFGRKYVFSTTIPLLGSVGCPYDCNFCIDWNSTYKTLSTDRLRTELEYLAKHLPGTFIAFHDPNFAIKFDQVLDVLASLPRGQRLPYIVESSLSVLRGDRPKRLKETNCASMAPGIESWMDFSKKAGVGKMLGMQKVEQVAAHCREIQDNVPYIQGIFILGLDTDVGDEPFELTKSFMTLAPFVWPAINIPVPFGNTPLYDTHLSEGRLLRQMPFHFYYAPYLVTTLKHYEPLLRKVHRAVGTRVLDADALAPPADDLVQRRANGPLRPNRRHAGRDSELPPRAEFLKDRSDLPPLSRG